MSDKTLYISIDIEADGPIPGPNSMLSLGAAAFELGSRKPLTTFECNLLPLQGAEADPETAAWWLTQPEAWKHVTSNQQDPAHAMPKFRKWLLGLPDPTPTFVGYPATYDFMFTYWYLRRFTKGPSPFSFSGLDIKTLAAAKLNIPYRQATKRRMPKAWFQGCPPHTHKALDDAIGQGILFVNIMGPPSISASPATTPSGSSSASHPLSGTVQSKVFD